jgi:hypothetical protein
MTTYTIDLLDNESQEIIERHHFEALDELAEGMARLSEAAKTGELGLRFPGATPLFQMLAHEEGRTRTLNRHEFGVANRGLRPRRLPPDEWDKERKAPLN